MFRCEECGYEYDDPITITICLEDEVGVSGMFPDMHYKDEEVCPNCGCSHYWSEEVDDEELSDEEG